MKRWILNGSENWSNKLDRLTGYNLTVDTNSLLLNLCDSEDIYPEPSG